MPHKLAPRLKGFAYRGLHRFFLTICVNQRREVFTTPDRVDPVISQLLHTSAAHALAVVAYCFMPDHMHALLEASSDATDFRECVRIFKQISAFAWRRAHRSILWQRSYYDRVLREDEDTFGVAAYVLENPVRAGLVKAPLEYPFLGSGTMEVRDLLESVRRT